MLVGKMAGGKRQHNDGEDLHQSHHAEGKGAPGAEPEFPGNGKGKHLAAEGGEKPSRQQEAEVAHSQNGIRVVSWNWILVGGGCHGDESKQRQAYLTSLNSAKDVSIAEVVFTNAIYKGGRIVIMARNVTQMPSLYLTPASISYLNQFLLSLLIKEVGQSDFLFLFSQHHYYSYNCNKQNCLGLQYSNCNYFFMIRLNRI
jgi:hypothetical protein